VISVIQKEAKKRRDSIEQYRNGGRPELAEKRRANWRPWNIPPATTFARRVGGVDPRHGPGTWRNEQKDMVQW